jgi:hypothetical protein
MNYEFKILSFRHSTFDMTFRRSTLDIFYPFSIMISQTYYLVRSRADGQYLVARPNRKEGDRAPADPGFLLLFQEHADALSYLNTHAKELADRFAVETTSGTQLEGVLKRWGFTGVGMVQDPLVPKVEFLIR